MVWMMNTKAQGKLWWIIIAAVVAIIVMIILTVIFGGKTTKVGDSLGKCTDRGGSCIADDAPCENKDKTKGTKTDAFAGGCGEGSTCCFKDD